MSDSDSGRALRTVMGLLYVVAGVSHILAPRAFERVVPPQLPRPKGLVYLSGIAEIVLGAGVLFERTRRPSAWGIVALLIAVFPANVYTVTDDVAPELVPDRFDDAARLAALLRLPMQAVLVGWAWLYTRPEQDG
ncbi:DoxX family protein [Halolamina salina]|uniref:MauE/DoxX family redox-associated membrane protein n=1 Tax=Halolamina salina TaxID=1220023 RepID=A0ABD6BAD4_9EURY